MKTDYDKMIALAIEMRVYGGIIQDTAEAGKEEGDELCLAHVNEILENFLELVHSKTNIALAEIERCRKEAK